MTRGRWRGRVRFLLVGAAILGVSLPPAQAQEVPPDDPARGLIHRGLRRAPGGPCGALFEMRHQGRFAGCTHGPDAAPEGVDVRQRRSPDPDSSAAMTASATAGTARCHGDGQSGARVQLIYARASDVPDRYAEFLSSFRSWAGRMDDIFNLSAAHTGGTRHIRFVHDTSCQPIVDKVELSPEGDDFMNATTEELAARGYNRTDRKYLVWMDATVYCGVANGWHDDSPDQENVNNGSPIYPGMTARIDTACWGLSAPNAMIEAHELGHVLGAVQRSAPNASQNGHCTDEYDVMCYRDGPSVELRYLCLTVYDYENRLFATFQWVAR